MNESVLCFPNILLDIAPDPVLIPAVSNDMSIGLVIAVAALIALAIVLIVRAYRKNKAKQNQDAGGKS
ncbi:MAG: hypothetical protein BWY11_02511 [Firmicutes bacterium ADurb.Bin182]|nr:MAG: hypothetical protein BWY11_02511 [Firmicutes bacterium ADurb.Bin182]